MNPQLRLFLLAMLGLGIAGGIFETTFNNFLNDTFQLTAKARGNLEFPRELPGFLTALFIGALFFLPETLVGAMAVLCVALGMFGLAIWGYSWPLMMSCMILWSAGTHLMMPVQTSIGMDLAHEGKRAQRLGEISAARIAANLIGCILVLVLLDRMSLGYRATFTIGGVAALGSVVALAYMRLPGAHLKRPKFIWNGKYWLFYVLCLLFGARKQIFITFGPWVLVKIFDQPATVIAKLWIVASVIGIYLQPRVGKMIDRFGERRMLMIDSCLVFLVCAGYGFSHLIAAPKIALGVLYTCYIGDLLLFGIGSARSTYLAKIAIEPAHVSPTLSVGITINHAVSMSAPVLGGLIWATYGHSYVFAFAAVIAVVMLVFTSMIRIK
jgi:predicted MFS family arabinose efflux permease